MKTIAPTLILIGLIVAAFLGGLFYHHVSPAAAPQQLTLEEILSIRELHLVKHQYTDIFTLHRKNDPSKPIRAIVHMPVTVTAFLNLKDIKLEYSHDSLKKVILPRAILNKPVGEIDRIIIRETRSFQLHAGKDLYPEVGTHLTDAIHARLDSIGHYALTHRILLQAEAEGREYIGSILVALGHTRAIVTFNDEAKDQEVQDYLQALRKTQYVPFTRPPVSARLSLFSLGIFGK